MMGVIWITILHALSFCFHRFFVVFEKAAGRLLISWDQIFKFFKLAAAATSYTTWRFAQANVVQEK